MVLLCLQFLKVIEEDEGDDDEEWQSELEVKVDITSPEWSIMKDFVHIADYCCIQCMKLIIMLKSVNNIMTAIQFDLHS